MLVLILIMVIQFSFLFLKKKEKFLLLFLGSEPSLWYWYPATDFKTVHDHLLTENKWEILDLKNGSTRHDFKKPIKNCHQQTVVQEAGDLVKKIYFFLIILS